MKKLTVDSWIEEAQIVKKDNLSVLATENEVSFAGECLQDDYNKAAETVMNHPELQVWTLVDGSGRYCYVIEGWHFVNRLGYFFGKKKIEDSELMSALLKRDGGISIKY